MAKAATQPRPTLASPLMPATRVSMLPYYARRLIIQPLTVDLALRLMGARALPGSAMLHFLVQGLPANDVRRAITHALRAVFRASKTDLVKAIALPALVISGGRDMIVPPRSSQHIYADLASKKQMPFYPNCGHICCEGFPDLQMKLADWFATYIH